MKKQLIVNLLLFSLCLTITLAHSLSFAVNTDQKEGPSEVMTRSEMIERLDNLLRNRRAVRERIPEIELVGDTESGYLEFQGIDITRLDDSSLQELLAYVVTEARAQQIENIERIQAQIRHTENIRSVNQQTHHRMPHGAGHQTSPPRVYSPPRVPPPAPRQTGR